MPNDKMAAEQKKLRRKPFGPPALHRDPSAAHKPRISTLKGRGLEAMHALAHAKNGDDQSSLSDWSTVAS